MEDLSGRDLGGYVLLAKLGAGAMGEVWRARQVVYAFLREARQAVREQLYDLRSGTCR